ncbi:MAG: flavin reductase (DIM6/NTAB) family NADH-FMN oxidoreductase RutF [Granulosicoccus sp.]|jgi:flavin reductase (DIM6/NTAB) family NADH-FMN oxidoreductase RutF
MTALNPKELRSAFSSYMTGVTVVTAKHHDGTFVGFTANSFTSVSLDPPLLLVCPGNHLNSFSVFETCDTFAVNVLSESQESVSNEFAKSKGNRFGNVAWQLDANGCLVIDDCSATFSCRVHSRELMGDHLVLIGEVIGFDYSGTPGLGYCSDGYFTLRKEREANAVASPTGLAGFAGALIEYEGQLLLTSERESNSVPNISIADGQGARSALSAHYQSLGLNISIGPVYSVYDDVASGKRYTFFTAKAESSTTGGLGEFYDINALSSKQFKDTAQKEMVKRFQTEFETKVFGLYLGDANQGEVHHGE